MTEELQAESRARIRAERKGNPHWTDLGDGYFALHIQYGGNAVVISCGPGSNDIAAVREWLEYHWPTEVAAPAVGRDVRLDVERLARAMEIAWPNMDLTRYDAPALVTAYEDIE